MWVQCPERKHHGVKVVWCAAASAVCHYHSGASCRLKIMERLSIPGGVCTREAAYAKDGKQLTKSDLQVMQKEKRLSRGATYVDLLRGSPSRS